MQIRKNLWRSSLVVFLLCCCQIGKSQTDNTINERQGDFYFSISPEYRITPFYTGTRTSDLGSLVDFQAQNASTAVNYDFNYFPLKNLALGFSHSLRYDHIVKGELSLFNDMQTIAPDENGPDTFARKFKVSR